MPHQGDCVTFTNFTRARAGKGEAEARFLLLPVPSNTRIALLSEVQIKRALCSKGTLQGKLLLGLMGGQIG